MDTDLAPASPPAADEQPWNDIRRAVAELDDAVEGHGDLITRAIRLADLVRPLVSPPEQDDEPRTRHRYTDHRNQLGNWCRWSLVKVTQEIAESDDTACPAGCPASAIEEVPGND